MTDNNTGGKEHIKRQSIDDFCLAYNMKKVDLAEALGVARQYLNHWRTSKLGYILEYNSKTGQLKVIQSEKVVVDRKVKLSKTAVA